jgi:hypothetical protein
MRSARSVGRAGDARYKIELTCGPGWDAPLIGRGVSLAPSLSLVEVESVARSMLELAREIAGPPKPDGYRITFEADSQPTERKWLTIP